MLKTVRCLCVLSLGFVGCAAEQAGGSTAPLAQVQPALSTARSVKRVSKEALLEELAPRLSQSQEGLVWRKRKDGGYGARLNGRFSHATMIQRKPDGRISTECVDDVRGVEALLEAGEP